MPELIPFARLALAFLPVMIVLAILFRWSAGGRDGVSAVVRMLVQLLLVGYALAYIFDAKHALVIVGVLSLMMLAASWIGLRTVPGQRLRLYGKVLLSMLVGGVPVLLLVTQGILALEPWFLPRYMVPLAGMIFANAMNSVSLAAERLMAELRSSASYEAARSTALRAALIPITNSLLAVGLVSFPGMMTGQILSGTSPLVAARYQIMVMCMVYASAGIAAAVFLALLRNETEQLIAAKTNGA